MAQTFAVEETIDRPVGEVWDALTDWSNAHQWMPGVDRLEAQGETAAGTELRFHARNAERTSVIARCDTGRSIVLRSVQGGVTADYTYELQPAGRRGHPRDAGRRVPLPWGAVSADVAAHPVGDPQRRRQTARAVSRRSWRPADRLAGPSDQEPVGTFADSTIRTHSSADRQTDSGSRRLRAMNPGTPCRPVGSSGCE